VSFETVDSQHLQSYPLVLQGGWRAQKHEPEGALGVIDRKAPGGESTAGAARDDSGFKTNGIHERREVRREIIGAIAVRGATRIAVTALCDGEGVNGLGQESEHSFERVPGVCDGVQKDHGNTRDRSLLYIGKPDLARKLDGLEWRHARINSMVEEVTPRNGAGLLSLA
jgi:hypothetical protein